MIIKKTMYALYMINLRFKGIKYFYIKKTKGEKEALKYVEKTALLWSKFTIDIIGIDLEIQGYNNIPNEACVFIGNHSSILDIPILMYAAKRNIGFIAKKEMMKTPIIGYWLSKNKSVPLDRESAAKALESINKGAENVKDGYSMAIFPEGTRNKEGKVGEFKKGSLKLAIKAKAKIVPVSIDRACRAFEDKRAFIPTKIKIVFGEPIETKDLTIEDKKNLMSSIRDTIINNLS